MRTLLKIVSIVPVCFLSWWCTSSLIAQQRPKPSSTIPVLQPSSVVTVGQGVSRLIEPGEKLAAHPPLHIEKSTSFVAMAGMVFCHVEAVNGLVTVDAQVQLMSKRREDRYLWRLMFLDAEGKIVDQKFYNEQIFAMEVDGAMEPTFSEITPLLSGTTTVKLSLLSIRPNTNLVALQDPEIAARYVVTGRATKLR